MTIVLDPVAVALGGYAIRWYGLFALAGLGIGLWQTVRLAEGAGLEPRQVLDTAAFVLPVGLLCARAAGVLAEWDYYFTEPRRVFDFGLAGLSTWGGIVGGALALILAQRRHPRLRLELATAACSGLALGLAISSIGAFIDGSGQGTRTLLPWGTTYSNPLSSTPDFGFARHPVQLYGGLIAFALWLGLARARRGGVPAGRQLWGFLLLFGAARVALAAVHLSPPFLLGMQLDQLLALGTVLVAIAELARGGIRAAMPSRAPSAAPEQV